MDRVDLEKGLLRFLAYFVFVIVVFNLNDTYAFAEGVVVEKVEKSGAAEQAGLKPGDVLLSWRTQGAKGRSGAEGDFTTIFDWARVAAERVSLEDVGLDIRRGEQSLGIRLAPGVLEMEVRPFLTGLDLEAYEAACQKMDQASQGEDGRVEVRGWRTMAEDLERRKELKTAWWLEMRAGEATAAEERLEQAEDCLIHAVGLSVQARDPYVEALTRIELGNVLRKRNQVEAARAQYDHAEELLRSYPTETMTLALALGRRGGLEQQQGNMDEAERLSREELDILNRLAPESLEAAASLHSLGSLAHRRGRYTEAEELYLQALALRQKLAPGSIAVGFTANNLGLLARHQGDLESADRYLNQALELKNRARPGSVTVANTYNNLGLVATARGHLDKAENYLRRALDIYQDLAPESRNPATVLNNLAEVEILRHRWLDSQSLLEQALAIHEEVNPESVSAARTLGNLGFVSSELDDLNGAAGYYQRAFRIFSSQAPDGIDVAKIETNLAEIAWQRNALDEAQALYDSALGRKRRLAPGSLLLADMLTTFAGLKIEIGDVGAADAFLQEALEIAHVLAPGSLTEARTLHLLGVLRRSLGNPEGARQFFVRAVDALEVQIGLLGGGDEARAGYRADYMDYYRDLIDVLLALGEEAEAFQVLERSRAQGLLALLAERDVVFSADMPVELDRERRLNRVAYDRAQQWLAELSQNDSDEIVEATAQLRTLRRQQEDIREKIRSSSPRFAELVYPQALDLSAARRALDPGTAVLSFSVGSQCTTVFVLDSSGDLHVTIIDVAENDLRDRVKLFRGLIEAGAGGRQSTAPLVEAGKALYRTLFEPVDEHISGAQRLLIVPDGVLHVLPFSALVRESTDGDQFVVEWKPISTVVSLTVFAQSQADRRQRREGSVVVFADPDFSAREGDSGVARRLASLPGTRDEAAAIAEVYGDAATIWMGTEATETRSRQLPWQTSIVHFATHVVLNEDFPLDSAIVLSVPAEDNDGNGLLQAWEIFESVRVEADLVTLSGCHAALGEEIAGEGLIGLVRAFQYAGARAVLASLWKVEDRTTAGLMRRFYGFLREGESKDQALRMAQIELIQGPIVVPVRSDSLMASAAGWLRDLFGLENGQELDASHPFFWAAFKIEGDAVVVR